MIKGNRVSLASWGRGRALPCCTFKYHTPRGLVEFLQALPRLRSEGSPLHPANTCWAGLVPWSLKDATMLRISPSTVCPGCLWFLFVPLGCISCQLPLSVTREGLWRSIHTARPVLGTCFLVHCFRVWAGRSFERPSDSSWQVIRASLGQLLAGPCFPMCLGAAAGPDGLLLVSSFTLGTKSQSCDNGSRWIQCRGGGVTTLGIFSFWLQ